MAEIYSQNNLFKHYEKQVIPIDPMPVYNNNDDLRLSNEYIRGCLYNNSRLNTEQNNLDNFEINPSRWTEGGWVLEKRGSS